MQIQYHPVKANSVADALSMKLVGNSAYLSMISVKPTIIEEVKTRQMEDRFFRKVIDEIVTKPSSNQLSGEVPNSIGNLSLLNELHLDNNRLQGIIPSNIGNCQSLILLNLSQNNFSGTIPKQLFSISSLSISLNLGQNSLFGSLPSEVGNLKNLAELDISENKLSGEVPGTLGSCTSLQNQSLEGNFIQGSIPSSLSSLRGIQYFDLSHDNLSGQIPKFLEQIPLMYLNLSSNNFEGEVPSIGIFSNASAISVSGNNRLCGEEKENQSYGSLARESFMKVSYKKLLKATDGFSSENLIGGGGFGSVYKGILDQDGSVVAVKVFNHTFSRSLKEFLGRV
ncbi:receptor kinase-like protein Xa21 [Camellia sinensis]|uniref:receptor kinase-like protein Xa21 n=1 Tax=Camellia sinensis TaxID=4442 RepID=UPI0010368900|nr:receptor kinase-like protein Xa21 [Camellia sinensis]